MSETESASAPAPAAISSDSSPLVPAEVSASQPESSRPLVLEINSLLLASGTAGGKTKNSGSGDKTKNLGTDKKTKNPGTDGKA